MVFSKSASKLQMNFALSAVYSSDAWWGDECWSSTEESQPVTATSTRNKSLEVQRYYEGKLCDAGDLCLYK